MLCHILVVRKITRLYKVIFPFIKPPQLMLQDRNGGHVFSLSISASVRPCHLLFVLSSVRPAFCPVKKTIYFRSLLKNTERISMKIVGENYYHEQIK